MKRFKKMLLVASCAAALGLTGGNLMAQGRGDPSQFRQMVIDDMHDKMDVKDDAEWNVIAEAIGKVFDARMEIGLPRMGGFFRGRRPGGGDNNSNGDQGGQQRRRGFQSPEAEDLQKSIDAKAPADEIKAKLAKLREATKVREAKLEKAQEDLKKLLTSRQEAIAVVAGLVK